MGKKFELVIFDLGNTLMYFDGDWPVVMMEASDALIQSLLDAGLLLDRERFLHAFRVRLENYYQERESEFIEYTLQVVLGSLLAEWGYPQVPDGVLRPAVGQLFRVTQAHWVPEKDAIPTLFLLRERGYRLALISNASDDQDVQSLVDKLGARPYFEMIVSSAAVGWRKPNPKIFELVLSSLHVAPERAVMVGDTLGADILGARNAGLMGVWITRRAGSPGNQAHRDTIHPEASIAALSELPAWLEAMDV